MIEALHRQEILTRSELMNLAQKRGGLCVSAYMPTSWIGADMQQNQIRFKNLLRVASERLVDNGLRGQDIEGMLAPAVGLQKNSPFWKQQNTGLACFIAKDFFRYYRLPLELSELVSVRDRFHLKPLLPLFSRSGRFYLLSVSKKAVHLYQGMRGSMVEVEPPNLPKGLDDTIKFDVPDRQVRNRPGAGKGTATLFHGHGGWQDDTKEQVLRYLNEIDRSIQAFMKDEQAPLVFAGVDYMFSFYRELTSYPNLLEKAVIGNPEALRMDELCETAWDIVEPYYRETQDKDMAQYRQSAGTGLTSTSLDEIVPASYGGRTGILFAAANQIQWGLFRSETNEVKLLEKQEAGSEDLCDLAAIHTFRNKGIVHELPLQEMPEKAKLAAVFRY